MIEYPLKRDLPFYLYFKTRIFIFIFNKIPNYQKFSSLRRFLLLKAGFQLEKNVKIFSPISISPKTLTTNIRIGQNSFINSGCRFSAPLGSKITIGKNVLIGPNVCFETVNHNLKYNGIPSRGALLGDIDIGEGVWIGINSVILQDVVIGWGSVIGACSLVNKSCGQNALIAGIPAKEIREIG